MTTRAEYEARRDAVAARITADPRLFDMSSYGTQTECGTVCCIAGHAALEAGLPVVWHQYSPALMSITLRDGRNLIYSVAEYLGLPAGGSWGLFSAHAPHQDPESAALALKQAPYVTQEEENK